MKKQLTLIFLSTILFAISCASKEEFYFNHNLVLLKDIQLQGARTTKNYIRDDNLGRGCSLEISNPEKKLSIIKKGTHFQILKILQEEIRGKKFTMFKVKSRNDDIEADMECWKISYLNQQNTTYRSYESTLDAFHTVFDLLQK